MQKIKIGNKYIGDNEPVFIIAEAGSNHNGKLSMAKELIDVASESGADAVKFQTFRAAKLYVKEAGFAEYLGDEKPIYQIIKNMEMPYEWIPTLMKYCRKRGIIFLSSTFDEVSTDRLDKAGIEAFKIASYDSNNIPLVRYVASKGKPIIMSTGLASMEELKETLGTIFSQGNRQLALMHCVAKYPAPLEYCNLRVMDTLREAFSVSVGYSDHTRDPLTAPVIAAVMGANLIEKHFTLSNDLEGPDHKFAIEPDELKKMVKILKNQKLLKERYNSIPRKTIELVMGSPEKRITPVEEELYNFARRHIHATRDIKPGEIITPENVAILRSGKVKPGMEPREWDSILGKRAKRYIRAYEGITKDMLE
jgi:N-acetylneuraminate synthase